MWTGNKQICICILKLFYKYVPSRDLPSHYTCTILTTYEVIFNEVKTMNSGLYSTCNIVLPRQ